MRPWTHYRPPGIPVDEAGYLEAVRPYYQCRSVPTVARSRIHGAAGELAHVSTVFLFHDACAWAESGPYLWETMVFGGPEDTRQERYSSAAWASAGHAEVLAETWLALDLAGAPPLVTVTWRGRWFVDPRNTAPASG